MPKAKQFWSPIPAAGLVVMSDAFYMLWVPSQDAKLLQVLTTLSILSYLVNSGIVILFGVFSAVNRVKLNSIAMLVSGACSVIVTITVIQFTDWDLYAVAGISSLITIVKNLVFTIPVASRLIGLKWYTFYPQVGQSMLSCAVIIGIGWVVRAVLPINGWITFFLASGITGILGLCANMLMILNKEERGYLIGMFKLKIFKKR